MAAFYPTSSPLYGRTVRAAGTVTAKRCVTTAGLQASALGQRVLGVSRYDVVAGQDTLVDVLGTAICVTGAAIALDDRLTTDAQGRVVPVSDAAHHVLGRAMTTATEAGQAVEILLLPQ